MMSMNEPWLSEDILGLLPRYGIYIRVFSFGFVEPSSLTSSLSSSLVYDVVFRERGCDRILFANTGF